MAYSLNIISKRKEISIAFDYLLAGDQREMEISIPLTDTDVKLIITADGASVRLSEWDSRMAKYLIQNAGPFFLD
mgnify:CR=1 FL=1